LRKIASGSALAFPKRPREMRRLVLRLGIDTCFTSKLIDGRFPEYSLLFLESDELRGKSVAGP
jgi:hypothetical protein